jgi:hypothetical protein
MVPPSRRRRALTVRWPAGGSLRAISMSATVRQAPALRGLPCPPLPAPGPSRPWKPAGRWRAIGAANHHRTKPAGDSAGQPLNRVFGRHRSDAVETVTFGLDGTHYEIDLNSDHAQELREQLSRYIKAARKVTGPASRPARGRRTAASDAENKKIRTWARERHLDVNGRGRIPADIVAQYEAANGK